MGPDGFVTPSDDRSVVHERIQETEDVPAPDLLHDHGLAGGVAPCDPAFLQPGVFVRKPFPVTGSDPQSVRHGPLTRGVDGSVTHAGRLVAQDHPAVEQFVPRQFPGPEPAQSVHDDHQDQSRHHQEAEDQGPAGHPDQGVILRPLRTHRISLRPAKHPALKHTAVSTAFEPVRPRC